MINEPTPSTPPAQFFDERHTPPRSEGSAKTAADYYNEFAVREAGTPNAEEKADEEPEEKAEGEISPDEPAESPGKHSAKGGASKP